MYRMVDQLDKKKKEEERKKYRGWDFEDIQEEKPTRIKRSRPLTEQSSVFTSVMNTGINTEQSVFDRDAVFQVKRNK